MATPFSTEQTKEPGISRNALLAAAAVVILLALVLAATTLHRAPRDAGQPDSYAANLTTGDLQLSEATNGTGGKVTYIDGTVKNGGPRKVTAATVQLAFPLNDGTTSAPFTVPLTLIRTREPYVDLEPVSAEPLVAGGSHDFRLILENVPAEWNQQPPQIRILHTTTE
ncbi:DUF2393 domain-containing protein [Terriglobus aquaticus]|uniref:DUF2393 domain-containing protein n=1 Tax=Terriglobus aquaticus TaxID=940139 RepID=A0ABW9KQ00_9BACT|nr:DUF2393 domain-containing protein [Terriglobus aquaticus]